MELCKIPPEKEQFWRIVWPIEKHWDRFYSTLCRKKSITATLGLRAAGYSAPDWSASHYIVIPSPVKNLPLCNEAIPGVLVVLKFLKFQSCCAKI